MQCVGDDKDSLYILKLGKQPTFGMNKWVVFALRNNIGNVKQHSPCNSNDGRSNNNNNNNNIGNIEQQSPCNSYDGRSDNNNIIVKQ